MKVSETKLSDDALPCETIRPHSLLKYDLIDAYASMFATSMKPHWDCRVYIDLFSGYGRSIIEETSQIVPGSPMIALNVRDSFDRHIFCEADQAKLETLRIRARREHPQAKAEFMLGDANSMAEAVVRLLPTPSRGFTVLSFCLVDPYRLDMLQFRTIERLSRVFMDFLILIPTGMDITRNQAIYLEPDNEVVAAFLGLPNWRADWERAQSTQRFPEFLLRKFNDQMSTLGYIPVRTEDLKDVRVRGMKVLLYHLVLFSRHPRAIDFWKKAVKSVDPNLNLF